MNKVKQILQWYTEGVPKLKISQKAGVSRNSVKSYIRQFIAMDKSLEELLSLADAVMDRIVHSAYRVEMVGESLRKRQPLLN